MELVLNSDIVDDGYEPRCTVCNCGFQVEIEAMREDNSTFEEIRNFLLTKNVEISLMALSRHFSRHYPQRKLYLENVECIQAKIDREVGLKIDEIFKIHSKMDKDYFEENTIFNRSDKDGNLEYMEKPNKEIFMDDYGFCHSCTQLCPFIPPKEAMYIEDVDMLYQNRNQEVPTQIKFGCIECKMNIQDQMILFMAGMLSQMLSSTDLTETKD